MDQKISCSLCHHPLSMFGNHELKDGVICKKCGRSLSPWILNPKLKNRTLGDIERHLSYRKDNLIRLENCDLSLKVEGRYNLYMDEYNQYFVFSKREDLIEENADLFELNQIQSMKVKEVPYSENTIDLYMVITLNHKEIDSIVFRVNEFPGIEKDTDDYQKCIETIRNYAIILGGNRDA